MIRSALTVRCDIAPTSRLTPAARPTTTRTILLATDGSDAADGAVRVASALAGSAAANVEVLAVLAPPRPTPAFQALLEPMLLAPGDTDTGRQLEHPWLAFAISSIVSPTGEPSGRSTSRSAHPRP